MGRKLSEEQKQKMAAGRAKKAAERARAMQPEEWTDEQKAAAQAAMTQQHEAERAAKTKERIRKPMGVREDITAVRDQDPNFQYRWVNDKPGRVERFKEAGYELCESATMGNSGVEGSHSENGIVSRDMGKGVTSYLMRQDKDWFLADQAGKQVIVDESEDAIRRDKDEDRDDGRYGEVKIN